jgi:Zn-dependent protease
MPLGPFALISLIYVVLGVRVVYQLIRNFRQTFDRNFTRQDRLLVDQAAFFVLVPISVALHELGHATTIWLFGGHVLDFGFYGFAGYVAFDPAEFTDAQQVIIASAGTIVNLLLAGLAVGLVFLKRPPMRAAINELLIQFMWVSLLNALVVYPLLDLVVGLNGDWAQMYDFRVPALSITILIIHVAVLGILFWAWRSPRAQARIAALTGERPGARRIATSGRRAQRVVAGETPVEQTLRQVAARVASGWPVPVEAAMQREGAGTALVLTWGDPALRRSVIAMAPQTGGVELSGALRVAGQPPEQRALGRDPATPDADRLTMLLRLAMETVEGWSPQETAPSPAPPSSAPTAAD